jgi:acyl-CoA thioesterase FadM
MASEKVVTAAISVNVAGPVVAGEPYVVTAWPEGRNGRSWLAGAALMGRDGEVLATSRITAVCAKWGIPIGLGRWRPTPLSADGS